MTTLTYLHRHIIPITFTLLPEVMKSPRATAMLLAIALQESKVEHRVQVKGPALGFWQFEAGGGVKGVRTHAATKDHLEAAMETLCYSKHLSNANLHRALEHNDVLACVFARLNLWWLPDTLPGQDDPDKGWTQYLDAWRPGKPHPETWYANYAQAWKTVNSVVQT